MVLNFYLEDLVTSEELISLLEQVLVGLLNGIVSLLDNDNNSEGPDPDDPDPEGEDPYPGGEDPDDDRPDKPDKDDSDTDKNDSDTDQDSPPTKKLDKGKGRAITPEDLPDSPIIYEEPLVPEEDERSQNDLEKAKANSLKIDREKGGGESSKQGGQREIQERDIKQEVKGQYNKAVQDFNDNQSLLVDNDNLDPSIKQYLIDQSQKLRETVDHYKSVKEDLEIDSSEPEESGSEYDSEDSDSDSENSRPSKRPKNK